MFGLLITFNVVLHLALAAPKEDALKITLIHINDIHSHFDQVSTYVGRCHKSQQENDDCYGGAARMYTKVKEIRDQDPERTLFLNAGDYYQGTMWYTLYKYKVVVQFANMLNYTAMSIGNHDFDDGVEGLAPFMDQVNFPVLAANIDCSAVPSFAKRCKKSTVVEIDGKQVGIIGYITPTTPTFSNSDPNLVFLDEIKSVKNEARRLKQIGVDIIIATGHSGYSLDKKLAAQIPDIDLVVGGHSHTFLYTGKHPPSIDKPKGDYPTYIQQRSGKVVPVVQVYCYSKYLGHLELNFDDSGELLRPVKGKGVSFAEPILLDSTVKQNEMVLKVMAPYKKEMAEYYKVIGSTKVFLRRNAQKECNLGDVVTDSMVASPWNDIQMAFMNNHGMRSDLIVGDITGEDVFNVLPFNNTVDRVIMKGSGIKAVLRDKDYPTFRFLQVSSGVRLEYIKKSKHDRGMLDSIQIKCGISKWCDLEDESLYTVAISSFLAKGGDQWTFPKHILDLKVGGNAYQSLSKYVQQHSPIEQKLEQRITFTFDKYTKSYN